MADAPQHQAAPVARIHHLPPAVVERIAAGEVIERPASVVRELLENALDAGATAIRVELRAGGLRLIRVVDDGAGIAREDLPLAVAPHATSKVASLADLTDIRTLGFRGEALASIAAVAELEIASSANDGGLAAVLTATPDGEVLFSAAARARGTTVTAGDLFAAVPARQAVLRGPRGEATRALAVVRAYALAHPDVSFTLISDGVLTLQTHGTGLQAAVTAIYGADARAALLPLGPTAADDATITGGIAARAFSFAGREHVVIAVNRRPVANRGLLAAAEAGYRPLLRKGRHPLLIVNLTIPPERLDPNVHPAKAEVLLRDEAAIAAALRAAVHAALGAAPLMAGADTAGLGPRPVQLRLPAPRRRRGLRIADRASQGYSARPEPADAAGVDTTGLTAIGQFDDSLILARSAAGSLYLVDQHRLHERALYEQLKQRAPALTGSGSPSAAGQHEDDAVAGSHQLLLEPVLVELTPQQAVRLAHRAHELAGLGLGCQPFGGSVFLIRTLPEVPGGAQPLAAWAAELARAAAEDTDDWLDYLCISLACRSAIRRGDPLSPGEQQRLLDQLDRLTAPAVCPHGSPLLLRLSASYLTRTFEW